MELNNQHQLLSELSDLVLRSQANCRCDTDGGSYQHALEDIVNKYSFKPDFQPIEEVVSILISDIRGFTLISENYPALQVIKLLNKYFQYMTPLIVKYGGQVDKFMGDSILAVFNTSNDLESSVLDTLACAIEMQIAMKQVNIYSKSLGMEKLHMGIGINTGEIVSSIMGSHDYHENTIIGDEVNATSRVEAFSLQGQILLSENTYKHVKDNITVGDTNEISVKGKSKPVTVYELLAVDSPVQLTLPEREGRKSPRVDVKLPSNYQLIIDKIVIPDMHDATILNLSYNGIAIETKNKHDMFSDIKLFISLSIVGSYTSEIYAQIRYVAQSLAGYEIGLEFTAIDKKAKHVIKSFVDLHI